MPNVKSGQARQRRQWAINQRPPAPNLQDLSRNYPSWNVVRASLQASTTTPSEPQGPRASQPEPPLQRDVPAIPVGQATAVAAQGAVVQQAVAQPEPEAVMQLEPEAVVRSEPAAVMQLEPEAIVPPEAAPPQNGIVETQREVLQAPEPEASHAVAATSARPTANPGYAFADDDLEDDVIELKPSWFAEPPKQASGMSHDQTYLDDTDQFEEPMNAGLDDAVDPNPLQLDETERPAVPASDIDDEFDAISALLDEVAHDSRRAEAANETDEPAMESPRSGYMDDDLFDPFGDKDPLAPQMSPRPPDPAAPRERSTLDLDDNFLDDAFGDSEPVRQSAVAAQPQQSNGANDPFDDIFDLDEALDTPELPSPEPSLAIRAEPPQNDVTHDEFRQLIEQEKTTSVSRADQGRQFVDEPLGTEIGEPEWANGWDDDHEELEKAVPEQQSRINLRGLIDKAYSMAVGGKDNAKGKARPKGDPFDDDF